MQAHDQNGRGDPKVGVTLPKFSAHVARNILYPPFSFPKSATDSLRSTGTNAGILVSPDLPVLRAKVWPARLRVFIVFS